MSTLSTSDLDLVHELIEAKLANEKMFTAFDITLEARKRNIQNKSHRVIRDEVHNYPHYADDNWERKSIDVGRGYTAFLYFDPAVHDTDDYEPMDTNLSNKAPLPSSTDAPAMTASVHPPLTNARKTLSTSDSQVLYETDADNRSRYCILSSLARKAGFTPSQRVYLHPQQDGFCVTTDVSTIPYKIDRNANIRIPKVRIGDMTGKKLVITATDDKI
jgi:hypothetical protein